MTIVLKSGSLNLLEPSEPVAQACIWIALTLSKIVPNYAAVLRNSVVGYDLKACCELTGCQKCKFLLERSITNVLRQ
jgi:hypothetical protein